MKHYWLFFLLIIPFFSCQRRHFSPVTPTATPTLVMLKVDYLTHQFEGGKSFQFATGSAVSDSIPLLITYKPPGDFGNITLQYAPTNDTLFDGGIVWSGLGTLNYPVFDPAKAFAGASNAMPVPAAVQGIYSDNQQTPYNPVMIMQAWQGIAKLSITQQMMALNAKAGLFLYTPSVGIGNPADWDYIWILYRKPM